MPPLIVLTTDFGASDPYVGLMKGVILGISSQAVIIDLTHQVMPQNILQASFLLASSYPYFPQGTIHVAVVDPGVGTSRRPILVTTPDIALIGPDNGIFSGVLERLAPGYPSAPGRYAPLPGCQAYHLNNPDYWRQPVSNTFHGRDIFAPVAAHLSLGVAPHALGQPVEELFWLPLPKPLRTGNTIQGQALYADHFGNLITNISAQDLAGVEVRCIEVKGHRIYDLSRTFQDEGRPPGQLIALMGSHGYLEIALPGGSAAELLGAGTGEAVRVTLADG
ncbi:MAG: SAM-dependent chlorinase/fluorinase [SAR202 cluster bacterium]|nr:SAM-dependent chlorinase/fluorinase [SAR202 cluster bacterium]